MQYLGPDYDKLSMGKLIIGFFGSLLLLFVLLVLWFNFFGPEQYYVFSPYVDTSMAVDYDPDMFEQVQIGMKEEEVVGLIGEPLKRSINTTEKVPFEAWDYTSDGKLLHVETPWYMCNDYAWYRSGIRLDSNKKVVYIDKGWSYD